MIYDLKCLFFLQIKQESSGWPDWCGEDEAKRHQYIRDYHLHEGIALDPDKIEHNPGLRSTSKLCLNVNNNLNEYVYIT